MRLRSSDPAVTYARIGILGIALLLATSLTVPPAQAFGASASAVLCRAARPGPVPVYRRVPDTSPVPTRIARDQARSAATVTSLPATILVPVYVHVVQGTHLNEQTVSIKKVRRVLAILRAGFHGAESPGISAPSRFSFTIKKMNFVRNDSWYHSALYDTADRQEKRQLHRGYSRALNLYFTGGTAGGQPLLGYSRFPWQYASSPLMDGVTVNVAGLPGGTATGYNLGDTVVHEVGHWFGLLHTFQGGDSTQVPAICSNDYVDDTPGETGPNFGCNNTSTLCDPVIPSGEVDPAFNFMDYTLDSCMRMFTKGQTDRMDTEYAAYRY